MPLVAFELDDATLRAVIGKNPNHQLRVTGTIELPLEENPELLGKQLREQLREHGIQKADAIAVLSRWQAEIREVTVPPAPDEEMPDLVRFQARNEFMSLTDDWRLDYIRLDQPADGPHRVLAAAASPAMIENLQAICQAAGITLKRVLLQPLALIDLFPPTATDQPPQAKLLIRPNDERADLSISVDGNLLVTRSIRFGSDTTAEKRASMLISESRRTLAAARSRHRSGSDPATDSAIDQAIVLGPEKRHRALAGDLTKGLGFTVSFVDAFDHAPLAAGFERPEISAPYAALLGALTREDSAGKHAIDFLSPRQTVVQHPNRNRWLASIGIALAASLMALIFSWSTLGSQQTEIDRLTKTLSRVSSNNLGDGRRPSVEQIMGEVGVIDQWKQQDINWLAELKQLSDRMLTPDDVIIDSLTASAGQRTPQLDLNSRVASVQKETTLLKSLSSRPYQLNPARSVEDVTDDEYPLGLDLQATFTPEVGLFIERMNQRAAAFLLKQNQPLPEQAPPVP